MLVLTCAGTQTSRQDAEAATPAETYEDPQARRARELGEEVYRHPPPTPPDAGKAEARAFGTFIAGPLKEWFSASRERVIAASGVYEEARQRANPHLASEYALEIARLHMFLIEGFVETGKAAMPAQWQADEQISAAYLDALYEAAAPLVERALAAIEMCLSTAERAVAKPPKEPECRRLGERLKALPTGKPDAAEPASDGAPQPGSAG